MTELEQNILAHIGRYRISLKAAVARVFFDDGDPSATLDALRAAGLVDSPKERLPGGYAYYHLTYQGTQAARVPNSRAKAPGPSALPQALATLYYCILDNPKQRRARLEFTHLEQRFPGLFKTADSVAVHTNTRDGVVVPVFTVVHFAAASKDEYWLKKLADVQARIRKHPTAAPLYREQLFRQMLLVPSDQRKGEFKRAIQRSKYFNPKDYGDHLFAKAAPLPETLSQFIKT